MGGGNPLSFFFSSRRRHTRYWRDWSSDVCSSDLEFERRDHLLKGAALAAQHDADAKVHDAYPGLTRRERRLLPLAADLAQEVCARSALLAHDLGAAVAVETRGRSRDQHARLRAQPRKRASKQARPLHAAFEYAS